MERMNELSPDDRQDKARVRTLTLASAGPAELPEVDRTSAKDKSCPVRTFELLVPWMTDVM